MADARGAAGTLAEPAARGAGATLRPPFPVPRRPHRLSLFAQPLDRAAFVAYFLGAVVPLAALAWVLWRYVRPNLSGGDAFVWLVVGLAGIGVLSLVAFLALRRTARQALGRLDGENRRLGALLGAARALAAGSAEHDLLRTAATSAAEISAAHAGFLSCASARTL